MKRVFILALALMMLWANSALAAGNIGVLWDWQAPGEKASKLVEQDKLPGISVLSPKWFEITDAKGTITVSNASKEYTEKAHAKGYKVWALITNSFDPELTTDLLDSLMYRSKVIHQLRELAKKYDLDGINIDFENINPNDKEKLTEYVAEIAQALHADGLTVSMDVTVPSSSGYWSRCYDRKSLAQHVDYLMVMAYDEHGSQSKVAGSVASLSWVEKGVANTLAEGVPAEKLVLSMPLYMRIWDEVDGVASGKTLSMAQADKLIQDKKLTPQWLSQEGQYYFEYSENGHLYRVWQENRRSLALKASLVNRYDLAGGAYWRSTLETQDVWQVLADAMEAGL